MDYKPEELLDTPETCDVTTEYDNRIEDPIEEIIEIDSEPEEEEPEITSSLTNWEDYEPEFARYERSYRARRIRELMRAPIVKKSGRKGRTSKKTVPA